MDTQRKLKEWIIHMEYDGEIPDNLHSICNASTSFIWEQVIKNAKPKQEIDKVKQNILINRLRKPSTQLASTTYKIKEIELYEQKINLEKRINILKSNINYKEQKLDNLSKSNKIKAISIDHVKAKILEAEKKEYMLNAKTKLLESEIQQTEETIQLAKSLTPVELEDNPQSENILETLRNCAEKLEKLLQKIPPPKDTKSLALTNITLFNTAQKTVKRKSNESTFEKYLSRTSKKVDTTVKQDNFLHDNKSEIKRKLFNVDDDVFQKTTNDFSPNSFRSKKRESLGILPDSCLNDEVDDAFYLTQDTICTSSIPQNPNLTDNKVTRILSSLSEMHDSGLYSETQITLNSDICRTQSSWFSYQNLFNNKEVQEILKNTLHKCNRLLIYNNFQTLNDNIISDLKKLICQYGEVNNEKQLNKYDLAKLHFVHVQIERKAEIHKRAAEVLSAQANQQIENIFVSLANKNLPSQRLEEIRKIFDLKIEDLNLDTIISCIKKEINASQKFERNDELDLVLKKTRNIKDQIILKTSGIQHYAKEIRKTIDATKNISEDTKACVRRLHHFYMDMAWAQPLTMNHITNEIKVFENFSLDYNRRFIHTNPKHFYRDFSTIKISPDIELDSNSLYMLSTIIESPLSPPVTIFVDVIKSKIKLNALKKMKVAHKPLQFQKYSLKDLESQESYIQSALDKMHLLINSTNGRQTLAAGATIKEIVNIWSEMPLKNYISSKHKVNGQEYMFFQQQYDNYYST